MHSSAAQSEKSKVQLATSYAISAWQDCAIEFNC